MKKIIAILLCVIMIVGVIPSYALAADGKYAFVTEGADKANRGDQLEFKVYLTSVDSTTGFELYLAIPEGMSYVTDSGKVNPDFKTDTGCDDFAFTEEGTEGIGYLSCAAFNPITVPEKTLLLTFSLEVDDDCQYAEKEVGVRDIIVMNEEYDVVDEADVTSEAKKVTVSQKPVPATVITLDKAEITLDKGATEALEAAVSPEDTTDTVVWTSDNEDVATVADGVVTAVKCGTATITATAGSVSDTCTVTVNHTFDQNVQTDDYLNSEATCTDPVTYFKSCECGEKGTETFEVGEANGHDKDWAFDDDQHWKVCSNCDWTGEAEAHSFVYDKLDKEKHTVSCEDECGFTDTEEHDWKVVSSTASRCGEIGTTEYECTKCGETKTETSAALEHEWDDGEITTDPTCTKKGVKTYTCLRDGCKETYTVDVNPLGHDWDEGEITTDPTCTEKGVKTYTCKRDGCGETYTEDVDALEHEWSAWKTVKEATEEEEGLEERTCTRCTETETRTISRLDSHKFDALRAAMRYYANLKRAEERKRAAQEAAITEDAAEDEIFVEAWDNPFGDIFESDSYYDAIEFVYKTGLFKGVSATAFAPLSTMTRAMFVTVLGRMADVDEDLYTEVTFGDVVPGEWYTPYVAWAQENGIVKGYSDVKFGVNDEITVEQAAVIIARFAEFAGYDTEVENEIENEDLISDWALAAMRWAVTEGILPDGYLPKADAPRALVAVMLYNFAGWCEE